MCVMQIIHSDNAHQSEIQVLVTTHFLENPGVCELELRHRQMWHRIIEWFGLEVTLKIVWFQPPCRGQGHLALDLVAQRCIQPGPEHFQGGGIHNFSGQSVPGPHHPHGEEFLSCI